MAASTGSMEQSGPRLEGGAIGLTEVLFQSITHMAPAVATALSIGLATTLAGGITPLAVVFALIACLFTAYSMSQLARHFEDHPEVRYGLTAMCIGIGMGGCVIWENPHHADYGTDGTEA